MTKRVSANNRLQALGGPAGPMWRRAPERDGAEMNTTARLHQRSTLWIGGAGASGRRGLPVKPGDPRTGPGQIARSQRVSIVASIFLPQ